MNQRKILFIDRDGTLIREPEDKQIDSFNKLSFQPGVVPALLRLKQAGYSFVIVSNQDGLGTPSYPEQDFLGPHQLVLDFLGSQGIFFEAVRICPHLPAENCDCYKPRVGLVLDYLQQQNMDREASAVIGDRQTDMQLAKNMGLRGLLLNPEDQNAWATIATTLLNKDRLAEVNRQTTETQVQVKLNLDCQEIIEINTGIRFFDHMLEQFAKHSGIGLSIEVSGDLDIDDHHTVEDTALVLGEALCKALGDKRGIARYGFVLPMDEALAQVALDLSGRPYFSFKGDLKRERVGDFATELLSHFFRSFCETLRASLHIDVSGENAHHMIEAVFKGVGRSVGQAILKTRTDLPSTKGVL